MNTEIIFKKNYSRILKILNYANQTNYYSDIFQKLKLNLDSITYEEFKTIPYLTKDIYRTNTFGIIRSSVLLDFETSKYNMLNNMNEKDEMLSHYNLMLKITSGSTGKPLEVIKSKNDNLREYMAINYYRNKMYGIDLNEPFVWVWPVSPYFFSEMDANIDKVSSVNNGYKYLISVFSDEEFQVLTDFCLNNNICWITSSPSMLYNYSKFLLKHNICINLKYIESHSEPLLLHQREMIRKAFGNEPVNVYGSNEVQFIGITCPNDHMHILENNVFVEIEKNEFGYDEIIVTSLTCYDSIFLRYRIGDCAYLIKSKKNDCIYNKNSILTLSNYRNNDLAISKNEQEKYEPHLITASIYALEEKFKIKIFNYKIIQKNYDVFWYYIDLDNEKSQYEKFLELYLLKLFGYPVNVQIKLYENASCTYAGKFKYFSVDMSFADKNNGR